MLSNSPGMFIARQVFSFSRVSSVRDESSSSRSLAIQIACVMDPFLLGLFKLDTHAPPKLCTAHPRDSRSSIKRSVRASVTLSFFDVFVIITTDAPGNVSVRNLFYAVSKQNSAKH